LGRVAIASPRLAFSKSTVRALSTACSDGAARSLVA
jgi:hypothetical protein